MKRTLPILVAIVCSIGGCTDPPAHSIEARLREPFVLLRKQTATFPTEGLDLTFTAVLSDDRCPITDTCVEDGEARAQLRIRRGGDTQLFVLGRPPDAVSVIGYDVKLTRTDLKLTSTTQLNELTLIVDRSWRDAGADVPRDVAREASPDVVAWTTCSTGGAPRCSAVGKASCCGSSCPPGWSCSHHDCFDPTPVPCAVGKFCADGWGEACTCTPSTGSCTCLSCVDQCTQLSRCSW